LVDMSEPLNNGVTDV